ncbi:PA0069 family radical SAM protein [Alisedimentitalea sp. MJ-SS2]|uniref:PA0069 family radical SAM protein n=1 Tax=Aliisedimentitalea sp. MJ-SS2 TaxID=3049795 RepID=UPI00290630FB|nr:PA0069 family radical SAM protein [Alisedimentitalea sp. MJ-SS2]MDU8926822.1 PA0069 family radical SAM protein [Alisedimentitalea sp. MJ-SS2]
MQDRNVDFVAQTRRRGRGAVSNAAGRYEVQRHEAVSDGWEIEPERPKFETHVAVEWARSLITYNRSPDLPFDRSINPYRGCEHGCIYCFARPSHAYLGLSPGLDFETRLVAKANAPDLLRVELSKPHYRVAPLAIGTNTDPYQPIEKERKLMRACLKVLRDFKHPVAIVTKGTMVERDLDILVPMAREGLVRVGVSVTTLDDTLARRMEPRVPGPQRRLRTIRRLVQAGVPVRLMASPIVPGLSDHEIEAILQAGAEAGADAASWIMLRLPREVSPLWREWLDEHYPQRAARVMARLREMHGGKDYDARWGHRMRGEGHYAEMIAHRFDLAAARLGLSRAQPELRRDLFRVPPRVGDQLRLF